MSKQTFLEGVYNNTECPQIPWAVNSTRLLRVLQMSLFLIALFLNCKLNAGLCCFCENPQDTKAYPEVSDFKASVYLQNVIIQNIYKLN